MAISRSHSALTTPTQGRFGRSQIDALASQAYKYYLNLLTYYLNLLQVLTKPRVSSVQVFSHISKCKQSVVKKL